jgi:hypothetical protein
MRREIGRTTAVRLAALLLVAWLPVLYGQRVNAYPWPRSTDSTTDVAERIAPPEGFERIPVAPGTFADWLRHLPLKPEGSAVLLHSGERKADQSVHAAVIDIDTGARDLQQCADAVIRLRAEYLYSKGLFDAIQFNFTSGDPAPYVQWRSGLRPEVTGSKVRWLRKAEPDSSHASFRKYLNMVFTYAGTQSLCRELQVRTGTDKMQAGDVFVRGGSPGHAVIVVDMARNRDLGEAVFLLAQSYMPAQDIHILKNPNDRALSPWYPVRFGKALRTPEWEFAPTELMHFAGNQAQNQTTSPDRGAAGAAPAR